MKKFSVLLPFVLFVAILGFCRTTYAFDCGLLPDEDCKALQELEDDEPEKDNSAPQGFYLPSYILGESGHQHAIVGRFGTEHIRFENRADGTIRMYKSDTVWEAFRVDSSGIRRVEDTSWSPHPTYNNTACSDGSAVAVVLDATQPWITYQNGDSVSNYGSMWAPTYGYVGMGWNTGAHQIVTINADVLKRSGEYKYCDLRNDEIKDLYRSPNTAGVVNSLKIVSYHAANTFTFCTGVSNSQPMLVMEGTAGPGSGDQFYYMQGWGLVGFSDGYHNTGLIAEGADTSGCN